MYWNKQEEWIFDIILFILVVFQVLTFFAAMSGEHSPLVGIFFIGLNLLFFAAMIPYAKWVWKTQSYKKALLKVAKHELFLLGLTVLAMIAAILMNGIKRHA